VVWVREVLLERTNYRVYIQGKAELECMKHISKCPKKGRKHDYYDM